MRRMIAIWMVAGMLVIVGAVAAYAFPPWANIMKPQLSPAGAASGYPIGVP